MQSDNYKRIRKVLWLILFANLGVAAVKIVIGYLISSNSLAADGFHSLTDSSSNLAGLIGIHLASKPIDEDHPYGHRKFETLAGFLISVMLFILAARVISSAFLSFARPVAPIVNFESIIAITATLVVNIFISKYEYLQGKKLDSTILVSDSLHTRSDVFISIGVLFTLISIKFGIPPVIDSIASLAVSGFVIHAACEIFRDTCSDLLDKAAVDSDKVKEIIMHFDQVKDVHKIRSRGCNSEVFVDLHILVDPGTSIEESHRLMHEIEKKVCSELSTPLQMIIHIEPFYEISKHLTV
ncbi:MAG: cation diffusion facilitator family transporter [Clostridia bacterium]